MGRKKRRISFGTVFMLVLTLLVIICCAVFLRKIAGNGLYARTGAFISSLSEQTTQPRMTPERRETADAYAYPEETPAPAAQATPAPQAVTVTLAAAGTVYAPKAIRDSAQSDASHFDFMEIFTGLGDTLEEADLSIVTLETTTAGEKPGYDNYNTPAELLTALRACGADLVSLATEHALDKGYDGLQITLSELTARGMACAGVRTEDGVRRGTNLIGVEGMQIAVLAYTYGLSDESKALSRKEEQSAVNLLDTQQMIADITQARLDGANLVVVLPHWGTKNKQETPESIRALAKTLAEAGADVILGTHPNVVQETERLSVTRSDGLVYDAVVCYSLGSLLTDARTSENTAGMIARLDITYDPVSRRTTLGDLACVPVYIARQKEDGEYVYRVVDTDNAEAVSALSDEEREAARAAAQSVRSVTGQTQREEEGQG